MLEQDRLDLPRVDALSTSVIISFSSAGAGQSGVDIDTRVSGMVRADHPVIDAE
jgi:hypothetical protein